jgi:hypothetical protein
MMDCELLDFRFKPPAITAGFLSERDRLGEHAGEARNPKELSRS